MSRYRNWCLTINNYDENDINAFNDSKIKYFCYGLEEGESGTPHIQGYIETTNPITLVGLKKIFPRAHIEVRRGNQTEAIDYCMKDGNYFEGGTKSNANGVRKDWQEINSNVKAGLSVVQQIEKGYGSLHNIQHIEKISKYLEPKRNWMPNVYWVYGEAGIGKSRWAYDTFGIDNIYTVINFTWWDGYDGHETILIDDYRADFCKFHDLLKLLDRYPYQVPIKGGFRQLRAKNIIITCPIHWNEIWESRTDEDLAQLSRRIYKTMDAQAIAQATLGNTN